MTRVLVLLTLPAVIGWSTLWASPSTALDTVQEANTTYRSALSMTERGARLEEFRRAERLYGRAVEQAEEEGRSIGADLWVNYGNAAIQAEHLGSAVYAYRRALKLDPNHERARKNLRHARSLLPSWAQPPDTRSVVDTFFFWHQALSSTERQLMAALAFAAAEEEAARRPDSCSLSRFAPDGRSSATCRSCRA